MKRWQMLFIILCAISLLALGLSYFVEYGINISPCILCKLQRWTYFFIGGFAILGLLIPFKIVLLRLIQLALLIGLCIAIYHMGVIYDLFSFDCAKIQVAYTRSWKILGLPAPLYNALLSLILLAITQIFIVNTKKA